MSEEDRELRLLVDAALREDIGIGDVTTMACVPESARGTGRIRSRGSGVVSGTDAAALVFRTLDERLVVAVPRPDGRKVGPGDEVLRVSGPLRRILTGERVALNFLTHLSGIATLTARFVEAAGGACAVYDTRKTLPGLRRLEKKAVVDGGGVNHRNALDAAILIKDNHLAAAGSMEEAVRRVRAVHGDREIILEVEDEAEALRGAALGVTHLLLDNMTPDAVRSAAASLEAAGLRPFLEVSGGVTLETVSLFAAAGADAVSVGALTHSAPALDLGLDVDPIDEERR